MQAVPRPHTGPVARGVSGARSREQRRDEEFTDYLHARQPALMRTAYLLTGDLHTAEDVLQTALAKLYLAWDKVHDRGATDAYVRRIMVNEHNSLWRRGWKKRERATETLPDAASPHRHDDGTGDALWQLVRSLPPKARAVVVLRYYEQLTEAETADVLGISTGTVKSQCSRALATLRDRAPADLDPRTPEADR
ncbi:SigE family RNA polymerase sigma factor [Nocardioides nanhaiensis]|uniref:SigE family RNA polymerase sigma factor n=1 Tax=Nocardioides nanhaiensis TaxID=1476871 RepID=A0ABP8VXI2_9ACTN